MTTKISTTNIQDSALTTLLGPKVTTIVYPGTETATDTNGGETINLTGNGFQSGCSVLVGSTAASVVTFISSTQISFTAPAMSANTYVIYVINPDGGTAISIPGISYSGTPNWTTSAGSLGTAYETGSISTTVTATGDAPITYTLASGTLPTGSTLSSSGSLSGTAPSASGSTTYSFTITAKDAQNQTTNRAFTLTINPDVVTWSTPADNSTTTVYEYTAISNVAMSATSAAGKSITYTANSLPTGLSISGANITGTPTVVASTSTLLTGTSAITNKTATRTVNFVVNQDVVTWNSPADNTTTTSYTNSAIANVTMSASSAAGKSITYTANALLTGLSISGANITGTPTVAASSSSLITATASTTNRTATRTFNWVISVANDTFFKNTTLLLNGETTVTPFISDASTNSFGLTINGDTKPVLFNPYQGDGYYSNYFNGSTDYLTAPASAGWAFGSGDFTVECWVYFTSTPQTVTQFAIIANQVSADNATWSLQTYNGNFRWTHWSGGYYITGSSTLVPNVWYHVAVARTGGVNGLFVNGVLDGSVTGVQAYTTNAILYIGNGNGSGYFPGYISNVRILKGTALYTSAFTPPTTPLTAVANTQILTCQSNRFIDNSTNAAVLTATGTPQISPNIPFTANSSYSTYGSTYFDGTGDYLTVPNSSAFALPGDFTIECWVYMTTVQTCVFAGNINTSGYGDWAFFYNSTSGIRLLTGNGSVVITGAYTMPANAWVHCAISRSGSSVKIFANGVLLSTTTDSNSNPFAGTMQIGRSNDGGMYLVGYLSDLRIVKGTAVYTTNFTPPTSPLTAISNTSLLTLQYNGGANNSGIIDNSNFNNIITRNGNATQGSFSPYSVTGWSTYYNGTTDYQPLPTNAAFAIGTSDFTVESWVMPTGSNLIWSQIFAGVNYGSSSDWGLYASDANTPLYPTFYFTSSGTPGNGATQTQGSQTLTGYTKLSIGQWNHIAVSRVSGTARMFINGVQTGPSVNASTWSLTNVLQKSIGGGYNGNSNTLFTGYISNLRVVSGTGLYTTTFTPSTVPLTPIAGTILLTNQSSRFIDNSPNNFALTTGGTPSVQAYSPFGSISEATPTSYSNYFNGSSDYFTTPSSGTALYMTGNWTIEFWTNSTQTARTDIVCANYTYTSTGWFMISLGLTGSTSIDYCETGGGSGKISGTLNRDGLWHHVALTKSGTSIKLFVDGTQTGSTYTTSQTQWGSSGNGWIIGNQTSSTTYYQGYISNLRVVNGTAVYTATFTPSTTPLTVIANTSLLTCQSTTIKDNSTNSLTITTAGSPKVYKYNPFGYTAQSVTVYTPSIHGGSAYFDGTGDYLTAGTFSAGTNNFTVECWFYVSAWPSAQGELYCTPWPSGNFQLMVNSNSTVQWQAYTQSQGTATAITLNQWYHIAVVKNGSNAYTYLNGVLRDTATLTNSISGTAYVGTRATDALYFNGYISDLRVTIGAPLYTSNFLPPTQTLTNYSTSYPSSLLLNFNNGGIIDQHGTNVLETVGNAQLSTAVKKYGVSSMYFDGASYLSLPSSDLRKFGTGDFTFEFWVYPTTTIPAFTKLVTGSSLTFTIETQSTDNKLWVTYFDGTILASTTALTNNVWTHFAAVRSSGTLTLYVNGTASGSISSSYNFGNFLYIGGRPSSQYFTGYMDDIRITKGYARYTSNFTAPTSALITK